VQHERISGLVSVTVLKLGRNGEIPCSFPCYRGIARRDGFAGDCFLRQQLSDECSRPLANGSMKPSTLRSRRAAFSRCSRGRGTLALAKEAGAEHLIDRSGHLVVSKQKFLGERFAWELREQNGISFDALDTDELRQLEPALSKRYVRRPVSR
jgi:hypothetical protein